MRVTVEVPYRSAGGVLHNKKVDFEVVREDGLYKAIPQLDENERRLANLPPELCYRLEEGRIESERDNKDGNLHVIKSIVEGLRNG